MLVPIPSGHHVMAGPAGRAATPSVDVSTALAPLHHSHTVRYTEP